MSTDDIAWLPAVEIARRARAGELDPVEVAQAAVSRVERLNPTLNAIIAFDPDAVLAEARALRQRAADERGALYGVPFTVKDFTQVAGTPVTEGGLATFADHVSTTDDEIVRRLRSAGAFYLGKTNSPQLGYCGNGSNPLHGQTENPWRLGYNPGGSSAGAAACVAAGLGPIAEGGDGAGSVRIPAALCGVVGMKPSLGRIPHTMIPSRYETYLYYGPITRTVADNALMLDVVSGASPADPMSVPLGPTDFRSTVGASVRGLRVAWTPDLGFAGVDPEVRDVCRAAVEALADAGATVVEATPAWDDPTRAFWDGVWVPAFAGVADLLDAEVAAGHPLDAELDELMAEVRTATALQAAEARAFRGRMWDTFSAFMTDVDVLASPTLTTAAFPHSQFAPAALAGEASLSRRILGWLLTFPYNMLTNPAITVPAGFTRDGLPVGLQLAVKPFDEATAYRAAGALEAVRPWADRRPPGLD